MYLRFIDMKIQLQKFAGVGNLLKKVSILFFTQVTHDVSNIYDIFLFLSVLPCVFFYSIRTTPSTKILLQKAQVMQSKANYHFFEIDVTKLSRSSQIAFYRKW